MFQHVGQHVAPIQNYRLLWYGPRLNKAEALKESSNDKECGHTKARIFHLTSTHLVMKTERESHKFENCILRYIITCVKGFILNTIIRCLPLSFLHTKQCNLKTQTRDVMCLCEVFWGVLGLYENLQSCKALPSKCPALPESEKGQAPPDSPLTFLHTDGQQMKTDTPCDNSNRIPRRFHEVSYTSQCSHLHSFSCLHVAMLDQIWSDCYSVNLSLYFLANFSVFSPFPLHNCRGGFQLRVVHLPPVCQSLAFWKTLQW